jgi:RNA polymerase sigma-70 factor (ECF subfamily)
VDLAEDAVQAAYVTALERWPRDGSPSNTAAWIIATARNRAIDAIRRDALGARKLELVARLEAAIPDYDPDDEDAAVADDRLGLIFACCHPGLSEEARIALTLRTLCGLTTEEIARAFLIPVPTMAQRLVRAKNKIRDAGISFEMPDAEHLRGRLDAVCTTIYVMFNEGYAATSGDRFVRDDLCDEAIRLARLLVALMPDQPEVRGLLALILLTDARREARVDDDGMMLTLEEQDRSKWNRWMIAEGLEQLGRASGFNDDGPHQIQAAIAAVHALAANFSRTNWNSIVTLYDRLLELQPSPIVELNRAAARAMLIGFDGALVEIDMLGANHALDEYFTYHAARADIFRRLGRRDEAIAAYERAAKLGSDADRRYIGRRKQLLQKP